MEQETLGHRGLARIDVRDHAEVSDLIDLRHRPAGYSALLLGWEGMKALIVGLVLTGGVAAAQPAAPDFERAKSLYQQASAEMKDGRYADAAKDFGAAYDITRDPVLFYKIATANQK